MTPLTFEQVRDLAVRLDGTEEGRWYGAVAFRVRGRVFARRHENDDDLVLLKVGPDERDALVQADPGRFVRTEHRSERDDSVLMRLSATSDGDLDEVAELLALAWERQR